MQPGPNGWLITAQYLGQRCCWLSGPSLRGSAGAHQEADGAPPRRVMALWALLQHPFDPPLSSAAALRSDRSYLGKHAGGTASASTLGGHWALFHAELQTETQTLPFFTFSFWHKCLAALRIVVVIGPELMKEVCQCTSSGKSRVEGRK